MKALIIDDERLVRESLKALIKEYCPSIESISLAENLHTAALRIEEDQPDIIFLDIHIYDSDGLKLLEGLPERDFKTIVVSGDETRGIDAIKMGVNDYLLKPINIFELQKAVRKIYDANPQKNKPIKISVADGQSYRLLSPKEIVRIEAHSNYSKFFLEENKVIMVSKTLKNFAEKLENRGFFRPHKSHLVNISYISGYTKNLLELKLTDGTVVPISRSKLNELIYYFNNEGKRIDG